VRRTGSLRVRLTIAFMALGGVLVVAASLGVSHLLGRAVWRPLDAALEEEADQLVAILQEDENEAADLDITEDDSDDLLAAVTRIGTERDLGPGKFVEVTDAAGNVLAAYGSEPSGYTHSAQSAAHRRRFEFFSSGDDTYRIAHVMVPDGGWVALGVGTDRQMQSLARAHVGLALGALAFLLALGAVAWHITTRAISEIDSVAADLEALEADSLDRRLAPGATVEIDRLVASLNRMLARLDRAVSHLRRFTADAAHELRTPVAALRARIEAALSGELTIDALRDGLLDSLEQTERLSVLAEDLLLMSAVEASDSLVQEDVDLADLVREVGEFFEPVAEEQGRALVVAASPGPTVRGSSKLLKRMLINLVDNAFRHTPPSSRIVLECRAYDGLMRLVVRDDGPGFEADEARLFRRFARGASEQAGTGLGLALCHEIARKHGATIDVESSRAAGTTVTVDLDATI
jgi:signal transduction histidine kinase